MMQGAFPALVPLINWVIGFSGFMLVKLEESEEDITINKTRRVTEEEDPAPVALVEVEKTNYPEEIKSKSPIMEKPTEESEIFKNKVDLHEENAEEVEKMRIEQEQLAAAVQGDELTF